MPGADCVYSVFPWTRWLDGHTLKLVAPTLASSLAQSLLLLCLGCDAGSTPAEQNSGGGPAATSGAARLEAEGRWLEAAALYRRAALTVEPPANGASIRKALSAYYMADRPADAEKLAAEIREVRPEFHEVLLYLADFQRVTMRYEEALSTIERFLEHEPGHVRGTLVSGLVLVALGETERGLQAIATYLRQPGLDPAYRSEAEVVRVRALRALGRYRDAADSVTSLLESRPLDPVVLAEAAQTYALAGKMVLSRAASQQHQWLSRRGHQLTVEDPLTLRRGQPRREGQARLALQARDRREFLPAISALRTLLVGDPGNSRIGYLLGKLYLRLGRYPECREVLDELKKGGAQPGSDVLHLGARLLALEGRAREATAEWRRAIETLGSPVGRAAARSREEPGDDTGAEAGAVESPAAILLAAADHQLETRGDLDLAGRWYARAAELAPESARPLVGVAWVAIRRSDLDRARSLLSELARRVDPRKSDDYVRLDATVRGLEGDLRFAARQLTSLIVTGPEQEENFTAFMSVFGDKSDVPEVVQVSRLHDVWRAKRRAVEDAVKQLSALPLEEAGGEYLRLGQLAARARDRDRALDAFMMAAALDAGSTKGLKAALKILDRPGDVFVRLSTMRRILQREAGDVEILELLAKTYLGLGVRLREAEGIASTLASLRPGAASEGLLSEVRARAE